MIYKFHPSIATADSPEEETSRKLMLQLLWSSETKREDIPQEEKLYFDTNQLAQSNSTVCTSLPVQIPLICDLFYRLSLIYKLDDKRVDYLGSA